MFDIKRPTKQTVGLILGPLLFISIVLGIDSAELSYNATIVAAVAALMACWWITEAISIPATALLPLVLLPLFGAMETQSVASSYSNHLIFLFLGGFLIAATIQRWNLHKRLALHLIQLLGTSPKRIVLGFMLASGFLSMWVSNTATAMMMLPIGIALILQLSGEEKTELQNNIDTSAFGTSLMLGIAYASSIGGVATLIGTPPNAILAGVAEKQLGITISFFDWFIFALPMAIIFLIITWYLLTHILFKLGNSASSNPQIISDQLKLLGRITPEENRVLIVFSLTALAWIANGLLDFEFLKNIKDSTIAICAAVVLFIIPAKSGETTLLDWTTAKNIPWDILILFGGGFALANAFQDSGLTLWIAEQLSFLEGSNEIVIIAALVLLVIFLTEITSNTATATIFLPLMVAFAEAMHINPILLMVPVAIAASYAFMLPVATPPNAIVFSSRQVSISDMTRAGIWLNLIASVLIVIFVVYILPMIWDIN